MFYLNVWLTVKEEKEIAAVHAALVAAGKLSRTEPGCVRWEAYQSDADPRRFLLVERWETKEHWEAHRQAEAVTTIYLPKVIPFVDRDPHPSSLVI